MFSAIIVYNILYITTNIIIMMMMMMMIIIIIIIIIINYIYITTTIKGEADSPRPPCRAPPRQWSAAVGAPRRHDSGLGF